MLKVRELLRRAKREALWQARKLQGNRDIALLGWHGEGAIGDDLLAVCVRKLLTDEANRRGWKIGFTSDPYNCDLIVIGGGTILGYDSMGLHERLRYAKAPFVFFGGGFRRETRKLSDEHRQYMKELFERARLVGVRGYVTQQFFIHNGIENVEVIGDPAWVFEPVSVPDFPSGFNLGVVVRNMGKMGEPQYLENQRIHQIMAGVTDELVERFDARPVFFSLAENSSDSDSEAAQAVISLMKHGRESELVPMGDDPVAVGSMMGKLDYLVSQRLHPMVLAWVQGKPCIAFEYQFGKTTDCMNSIGMDEFVIRTDEFRMDTYMAKFNRLWAERDLVNQHAQRSIDYWRRRLRAFAQRTLDLLA